MTFDGNPTDPVLRYGIYRHFGIRVEYVRTHTVWSFKNRNKRSRLEITEVLENEIRPLDPINDDDGANLYMQMAQPRMRGERDDSDKEGFPSRWYEAAITSRAAEHMLSENQELRFGEVASWTSETFRLFAIVPDLAEPALRMVQEMDSVGARNDNRQEGNMIPLRGNTKGTSDDTNPHTQF